MTSNQISLQFAVLATVAWRLKSFKGLKADRGIELSRAKNNLYVVARLKTANWSEIWSR
jgi:hypothetical protein